jgi:DNA-binding GntR family transcriptional regulator
LTNSSRENGWADQALDFDVRFHDQLSAACGNRRLQAEIAKYRRLVRAFCRMLDHSPTLLRAFREHQSILEALERRDPLQARWTMEAHIVARMQATLEEIRSRHKVESREKQDK